MKDFFDTNVLIAASLPGHPHHETSSRRLSLLRRKSGACAAHSLAEAYSALTRSSGYAVPPEAAADILRECAESFTLIALTPAETLQTIEAAANQGLSGPILYDALILACARKAKAKRIYTHNLKHFRQVAPDLAASIMAP